MVPQMQQQWADVKGNEGNYALAIFRHILVWKQASQGSIPFHRRASWQSLGSGKLSPSRGSGTLGFRLSVLLTWVRHHPCLLTLVLSGSLQRKQTTQQVLRGFLRFHGTQNLHGGRSRAALHFLLQAHGNSNTSGKKEAGLNPIMASTPP